MTEWRVLREQLLADPECRAAVEKIVVKMERRYNRPWWRVVRAWDRWRER